MAEEDWQFAIEESELEEGEPARVKVGDEKVLLVRLGGKIHACGGTCTHYGGPLHKGLLKENEVTCPWHSARFDVETGQATSPPALNDAGCFPVKVEDGKVYVGAKKKPAPNGREEGDDRTFLIVGGGAAGNSAAETLRREGFGGRIVMLTPESDRPYDRPSLSKEFLSGEAPSKWIPLHGSSFYEKRDIEIRTGCRAAELVPDEHVVRLESGEEVAYDRVLCATGGRPNELDIPGAELDGCYTLRSFQDARDIVSALDDAERAVIIGAGFIGMEAAAALREREMEVRVVAPEEVPLARVFGEETGRWLYSMHCDHGVEFHLGTTPDAIRGSGHVEEVQLADGDHLKADFVLTAVGISPVVDWLESSGVVEDGVVPVDSQFRTKAEDVFAAGDIAAVPADLSGLRHRVEHWVSAERQGQHAAQAMLGNKAPYGEIPFFWTMQFETPVQFVGYPVSSEMTGVRGSVAEGSFLVGHYQDHQLVALCGSGRSRELFAVGEILKTGGNVSLAELEDESCDLVAMMP
jgi:NADPH-dependent 2,4-dienoyl-CoA reductase/sulfur reductase-like enzyme/nitrite reductase/ring-hydroxylating ferredoxin subunit